MRRRLQKITILSFLLLSHATSTSADDPVDSSKLTVNRIFGSREFSAERFSLRWTGDGEGYLKLEPSKSKNGRGLVRYDVKTNHRKILVAANDLIPKGKKKALAIQNYSFSNSHNLLLIYTNSRRVWRTNTRGDYWVFNRKTKRLTKLGGDAPASTLMFAKISPDEKQVAYVRENNIYLENLADRSIRKITETKTVDTINGTFDWVYEEELSLKDGFRWSPDGLSIAYWQLDTEGVERFPLVNNTDTLYPKIKWIPYPKVGQKNSSCRVGVVSLHSGKTKWLKIPGDPRNHYIARMEWAGNNNELIVQQLNRLQNTNTVFKANVLTDELEKILVEKDEAWVDIHDEMFWFDGGKRFTWISERDGWRHVYSVSRDGKKIQQITRGKFDVIRLLKVDEDGKRLFFLASPKNPTQQYLYSINLDGSNLRRLTPPEMPGNHTYRISPNAKYAVHSWSRMDSPPVLQTVSLDDHRTIRTHTENKKLKKKLKELHLHPTEFFRVDIGNGVQLDGWCMKPANFDAAKQYPLLFYVYGEPAGATVIDRWGGSTYLWHQMLAQNGYIVMSLDNRGTKVPRGRKWRKSVYKKIGIIAPKDQAAAVKTLLAEHSYLDANRIGIWGWSGGGSMSLNAIFKYPALYKTAIAVAPVANQLYYDTIYQERYMGLPQDNREGFHDGSPINFAHQLRGNLLLIHGTGDDNCHYQTSELLINELIRHNKQFRMMAYPNRTHAIREGQNTSKHLRETMTRFLLKHLPAGGVSRTE